MKGGRRVSGATRPPVCSNVASRFATFESTRFPSAQPRTRAASRPAPSTRPLAGPVPQTDPLDPAFILHPSAFRLQKTSPLRDLITRVNYYVKQ
jgi:hypothetical protein